MEESQCNSTNISSETTLSLSQYLSIIELEVLARIIQQLTDIKGIDITKEEAKLSLVAEDIKIYICDSKNSIRELLQLINTFREVARNSIKLKKSIIFLYKNDNMTE